MISLSPVFLTKNDFNLSMKCMPDDNTFNYTWERKLDLLPSRVQGINTSSITIVNLVPKDSGEYRCVLSNSTGTIASKYFKLTAQGINAYYEFIIIFHALHL